MKRPFDHANLPRRTLLLGSPGMDDPVYGGKRDPYQVLLVQRDGSARVFTTYQKGNA